MLTYRDGSGVVRLVPVPVSVDSDTRLIGGGGGVAVFTNISASDIGPPAI